MAMSEAEGRILAWCRQTKVPFGIDVRIPCMRNLADGLKGIIDVSRNDATKARVAAGATWDDVLVQLQRMGAKGIPDISPY